MRKLNLPALEEKILKFWKKRKIFEKSLEKTKNGPKFIFYEGPPFANGLPGIHHLLSRALKDIILRYKTMQGFFVERRAGWDTHGLPTEMEAEKKLGIKSKKEIEKIGIEKFIEECRRNVFTYKKEWEKFTERIGFWLDLKNAYITCSNDYIESLWWILKEIWEKGLLYKDYKVVPYCPRCGTSLSSHEVAQGYKKIKEPAIYVKFKVLHPKFKKSSFLVWTTTPWTLPGNVAIAINPNFIYVKVKVGKEYLILAEKRVEACGIKEARTLQKFKGKELLGIKYQPLFTFCKAGKKAHFIIPGNFVSLEEGTGLVHIAPAFGEEDMEVAKENNLPILMTVDEEGKFTSEITSWQGLFVKEGDPLIIKDLEKRNLLFREELYEHDYPFCWRCDTPLLYYAKTAWFIKMTRVKKDLIKNNQKINWIPKYLKEGRFGEWLKEIKDWNLSRERYWGTSLPIWECEKCKKQICIGSIEELTQKLKEKVKIKDLHRPFIDKLILRCECGGQMMRVPEVIDCWFDSGSMPFAQWHYPFANKDKIDKKEFFPADYIAEGIDQTRGWFYTLLALSTLLGFGPPYKNVISHGIILDAKGQKMSKSKGNVIRPEEVINKYGVDCARFYFYTASPVWEAKRFNFQEVEDLYRKFFDTLWQSYNFFSIYQDKNFKPLREFQSKNLLDKWILSKVESLNFWVIKNLDKYEITSASRLFKDFVEELSNWYIRRSRRRFQKAETKREKIEALGTLSYVLLKLTCLIAPFCPFIAEELYQNLGGKEESVHLASYPKPNKKFVNKKLEEKMEIAREIVASVLRERARLKIKVRQPLGKLTITNYELKREPELLELAKEEVNVKKIVFGKRLKLDTKITKELKEEGIIREVIRHIQEMRKKAGFVPKDKIIIEYQGEENLNKILAKKKNFILKEVIAKDIRPRKPSEIKFILEKELKIDNERLSLRIKKA